VNVRQQLSFVVFILLDMDFTSITFFFNAIITVPTIGDKDAPFFNVFVNEWVY